MNIIKLDDLKGRRSPDEVFFSISSVGKMYFSHAAKNLFIDKGEWLHFYQGDDNEIYIKIDREPKHGVLLKPSKKGQTLTGYSQYMGKILVGENEKSIKFNLVDADFGKYKIEKI